MPTQTKQKCWPWPGNKNRNGYGLIKRDGKQVSAHRVSYAAFVGPIPPGLNVLHACDNPSCVNPDHLHLGTHEDNVKERVLHNRSARGSRIRQSRLTEDQVREIRKMYALTLCTQKWLATRYGVKQNTISAVITRKTWGWVDA